MPTTPNVYPNFKAIIPTLSPDFPSPQGFACSGENQTFPDFDKLFDHTTTETILLALPCKRVVEANAAKNHGRQTTLEVRVTDPCHELQTDSKNLPEDIFPPELRITDRPWQKCMALNRKKYGYRALRRNEIPDQRLFNELGHRLGRKSKLVSNICDQICKYIKGKSDCIIDVWAAYTTENEGIIFVILLDNDIKIRNIVEYSYVKRLLGEVNDESKDVIYSEDFDTYLTDLPSEEKGDLQRSINSVNVELMKKHKYLMMISGSPVCSSGYYTPSHKLTRQTCIVFHVLVKGYIPIREEPFKTNYNGVPVDVREGWFKLFTGRASDFHENVKHGCKIQRHLSGTLGGFLNYHGFGTCGITCAHVLLTPGEMKSLNPDAVELKVNFDFTMDQTVYQPIRSEDSEHCALGRGVKAVYKPGGHGESGIDVAVFQIDRRYPVAGDFPLREDGSPCVMSYDSGKIADFSSRLGPGDVIKYGAVSHLTNGKVISLANIVSVKAFEKLDINNQYDLTLHNLLEIITTDNTRPFADPGDSGALVFCRGENNDLFCVGMVEGGTSQKTTVVVPIAAILQELNVHKLKSFHKTRVSQRFEHIESRLSVIEQRINESEHNLQNTLSVILQEISNLNTRMGYTIINDA